MDARGNLSNYPRSYCTTLSPLRSLRQRQRGQVLLGKRVVRGQLQHAAESLCCLVATTQRAQRYSTMELCIQEGRVDTQCAIEGLQRALHVLARALGHAHVVVDVRVLAIQLQRLV